MTTRILALLAVLALAVAACATESDGAAGPTEGIAVHGDWTIDVYNPDGSLVESTEFSNDLGATGAKYLALLLAGERIAGEWHVEVNWACTDGSGSTRACRATQVADFQPYYFPTLTVDSSVDGQLTLSGSVVAQLDAQVQSVSTRLATCNVGATDCLNSGLAPASFSGTALATPVPVTAGQTIQVEVVFTFD